MPSTNANIIYLAEHKLQRQAKELIQRISTSQRVLNIIADDIMQKVLYIEKQQQQVLKLLQIKQQCDAFVQKLDTAHATTKDFLRFFDTLDGAQLSVVAKQALLDSKQLLMHKELHIAIERVHSLLEDLIYYSERNLLASEIQFYKIEDSLKQHDVSYDTLFDQVEHNQLIARDDFLAAVRNKDQAKAKVDNVLEQYRNIRRRYYHEVVQR